jgi:hypothetical protein
MLARVTELGKQQGAMTAGKQAAAKELKILLTEGQRLGNDPTVRRSIQRAAVWIHRPFVSIRRPAD